MTESTVTKFSSEVYTASSSASPSLDNVFGTVQNVVKNMLKQPVMVIELSEAELNQLELNEKEKTDGRPVRFRVGYNKSKNLYHCLVTNDVDATTFSLIRTPDENDAIALVSLFHEKLTSFVGAHGFFDPDVLSRIISVCRDQPELSCAHVAMESNFINAFNSEEVKRDINSTSYEHQQTPLHLAVKDNNKPRIKLLLDCGAAPDVGDEDGNTPLHFATGMNDQELISLLMSHSENKNPQNKLLETPILMASRKGNFEDVVELSKHGGDFAIPDSYTFPIFHAFEDDNKDMINLILKLDPDEACRRSSKRQTPLHLATSIEQINLICEGQCALNAQDSSGDTVLHAQVKAEALDLVVNLLAKAVSPEIMDNTGDSPLHTAAKLNNLSLVQAMIVFGANINTKNGNNQTARHIAAMHGDSAGAVLRALHMVGAKRCDADMAGCNLGCKFGCSYDGDATEEVFDVTPETQRVYDDIFKDINTALSTSWNEYDLSNNFMRRRKDTMLTLDGGGMRGIITCQILSAIQNATDRKIVDCFDWIAGSSTGALTGMMLSTGFNVDDCMREFFYMKDKVFSGPRPFDNDNFEALAKEAFPETLWMTDIEKPRNYPPPETSSSRIVAYSGEFDNAPRNYKDVKVWEAVRASVAAPSYFLPFKNFLDGGLMSNNPTIDALTEATEYYAEKRNITFLVRIWVWWFP